ICTICSAVKVAGAPRRGLSVKTSSIIVVSALSLSPSASTGASLGVRASQRWRHTHTVPRLRCIWRAIWLLLAPASIAKRSLARRTSRWGLVTACDLLHADTLSGRERDGRGY